MRILSCMSQAAMLQGYKHCLVHHSSMAVNNRTHKQRQQVCVWGDLRLTSNTDQHKVQTAHWPV